MVKGNQRAEIGENKKYVGFTSVEVRAINPTREELNTLLGRTPSDDDKEIEYLSEDQEGNKRVRLAFWLYSEKLDKFFSYSFNITNKERTNKDGDKNQYVNSVCATSWTDDPSNLPNWFTHFIDRKTNEELGEKEFRKALLGEEELATLLRTWLGRMSWSDPDSGVLIDTEPLFDGDVSELRDLIGGNYDTPFIPLLGVRTDENDSSKQYQSVYGKGFLPNSMMKYIQNGFKFGSDKNGQYSKKIYDKFEEDVEGEYGFNSYFELVPATEYDASKDVATSRNTKADVTPANSKF